MNIVLFWRRPRVLAIGCAFCHRMYKPRQLRYPARVCRACEKVGANQTWKPSKKHLERAFSLYAQEEAARRKALADNYHQTDVTLAGR